MVFDTWGIEFTYRVLEFIMKLCGIALALTLTVLTMAGCARPRPCPIGFHLGPLGGRCISN